MLSPSSEHYFQALSYMGKQHYNDAFVIPKTVPDDEFGFDEADKIVEIYKMKKDFHSTRIYFQQMQHSEKTRAIARLIPQSEIYSGRQATEAKYKARSRQFRYLHLATHNLLNDQRPMFSRFVLAPESTQEDGYLNMYEIFNLKLNGELVVLSDCDSGWGKFSRGKELVSLSHAFRYAGAPSIIVSLWWIEDASTAYLMPRFYSYLKAGVRRNVALQQAKIDLVRAAGESLNPAMHNPYYCEAFVFMGDGS